MRVCVRIVGTRVAPVATSVSGRGVVVVSSPAVGACARGGVGVAIGACHVIVAVAGVAAAVPASRVVIAVACSAVCAAAATARVRTAVSIATLAAATVTTTRSPRAVHSRAVARIVPGARRLR